MEFLSNIIVYGADWCPDCIRSKRILDSYNITYTYIDLDENEEAAEEVVRINKGLQRIPTILFPDGKILVEPPNEVLVAELKERNLIA